MSIGDSFMLLNESDYFHGKMLFLSMKLVLYDEQTANAVRDALCMCHDGPFESLYEGNVQLTVTF